MGHVLHLNFLKLRRGGMGGRASLVALGICGLYEKLPLILENKCWMQVKCGVQHQ